MHVRFRKNTLRGVYVSVVRTLALSIAAVTVLSVAAEAHSVKQRAGVYKDNQGLQRSRVGLDGSLDFSTGGEVLTSTSYTLGASRDTYDFDDISNNKYQKEIYDSKSRKQDSASISASQTWKKITDTRVLGSYSFDGKAKTRTAAVGASQWVAGESWQLSLDVSRTLVEKPEFNIVDFDSQVLTTPSDITSTGTTFGVRNLSTPTTITIANYTEIRSTDRPVTRIGSLGVRQYVIPANGAIHATATKAYNRGTLSTDTTYGQVDAWQADVAWLQTLWRGATGKIGYRWYREDETTRAYSDELIFGSDMVSAGVAQDLPKVGVGSREVPLSVELSGTRYATNKKTSAGTVEFGLTGKF